jgi:Predicted Zn-dependent peptidases
MRETLNELRAIIGDRPPEREEVDKLRMQRIRTMPGSYETAGAVMATLSSNRLYGRPDDYAVGMKGRLEALSDAEVAAAARKLFAPEAYTWIVIGDLSKIEQPVRALGIGEVTVLDEKALGDE